MSSDKQPTRSEKAGAIPTGDAPSPAVRSTPPVRRLFEVQAKPLETGVVPVGKIRAPRRKKRLWAAAAVASLISFNLLAAEPTNSPAGAAGGKTNAPAPETAGNRSPRGNDDRGREGRDRSAERSTPPTTNTVVRAGQKQEFSAFRVVAERNIFDPNRSPRRATNNAPRARPKVTDSLALVGVMNYDKGAFAFFDGSRGEFRKALKPSDKIAGLKIVSVDANSVKLAKGDKTLELAVGSQLRREDEGEWQPGGAAEASHSSSSSTSSGTASTSAPSSNASAAPAAAPSGADNDVLRRLMQRREQE